MVKAFDIKQLLESQFGDKKLYIDVFNCIHKHHPKKKFIVKKKCLIVQIDDISEQCTEELHNLINEHRKYSIVEVLNQTL